MVDIPFAMKKVLYSLLFCVLLAILIAPAVADAKERTRTETVPVAL